jgi:glucose-1-phosphate thymidylyltransferase
VESFNIGVGWKGALFEEHLLNLKGFYSIDIVQVTSLEKGPLHTLSSVIESWDDEPFLICPADYVVPSSLIKQLIMEHKSGGDSRLVTISMTSDTSHESPIYVRGDGSVSGIGKPLSEYDSMNHSAMLVAVNPTAIDHIRAAHESGEKTVVAVLNQMIAKGIDVSAANVDGKWFDIDSISDLLSAKDMVLNEQNEPSKGCIVVPPGDTIEIGEQIETSLGTRLASGVSIIGPAFIGPACRIEQNCRVGPFVSMEHGTEIYSGAIIEGSLLFESARVDAGVHVSNAIVYGDTIIVEEGD